MPTVNSENLPVWMKTVIILAGIIALILYFNKTCEHDKLRDFGCKTTGVITKKENSDVEYDYKIDGKVFHGKLNVKAHEVIEGDMYTTFYDCNDKTKSFIALDEKVLK